MSDTITITGNITEPELRHLPSGVPVLNFKIGSAHRVLDKTQDRWVEASVSWYSVSAFRALADHGFASLHRGDRVVVHGRIKLREWENGSGSRGFAADIEADSLGHDLMFGTSTFAKAVGQGGTRARSEEAWAPGSAADAADETASPALAAPAGPDRELVLAGADGDADDAPF